MTHAKRGSATAVFLFIVLSLAACVATTATETEEVSNNAPPATETTAATAESTAVTPTPDEPQLVAADLPDMGEAPEILNEVWINTERPVTLASSRGKAVLLEFWTFG